MIELERSVTTLQGMISLISQVGLKELNTFIVLTIIQIVYSGVAMALGRAKSQVSFVTVSNIRLGKSVVCLVPLYARPVLAVIQKYFARLDNLLCVMEIGDLYS
ncbi:hypothetical protein LguiB_017930 [Lonicera macranthoides]